MIQVRTSEENFIANPSLVLGVDPLAYIPGTNVKNIDFRPLNELLENAFDQAHKAKNKILISVTFDRDTHTWEITNTCSIPIDMRILTDQEYKVIPKSLKYAIEAAFGAFNTSSNYNTNSRGIGIHGYGASIARLFSSYFELQVGNRLKTVWKNGKFDSREENPYGKVDRVTVKFRPKIQAPEQDIVLLVAKRLKIFNEAGYDCTLTYTTIYNGVTSTIDISPIKVNYTPIITTSRLVVGITKEQHININGHMIECGRFIGKIKRIIQSKYGHPLPKFNLYIKAIVDNATFDGQRKEALTSDLLVDSNLINIETLWTIFGKPTIKKTNDGTVIITDTFKRFCQLQSEGKANIIYGKVPQGLDSSKVIVDKGITDLAFSIKVKQRYNMPLNKVERIFAGRYLRPEHYKQIKATGHFLSTNWPYDPYGLAIPLGNSIYKATDKLIAILKSGISIEYLIGPMPVNFYELQDYMEGKRTTLPRPYHLNYKGNILIKEDEILMYPNITIKKDESLASGMHRYTGITITDIPYPLDHEKIYKKFIEKGAEFTFNSDGYIDQITIPSMITARKVTFGSLGLLYRSIIPFIAKKKLSNRVDIGPIAKLQYNLVVKSEQYEIVSLCVDIDPVHNLIFKDI